MKIIGYETFYGCLRLTSIIAEAITPPVLLGNMGINPNIPVYVPKESISLYKNAKYWEDLNIIGIDITDISEVINDSRTDGNAKQSVYNLKGNRLNTPKKGLNIINGKKVVIR